MPFDSSPSPNVTPADIIDEAVALIEERGWCQGAAEDYSGRLCILGAMHYAARRLAPDKAFPAYDVVDRHFKGSAAAWNDEPGRTKAEVLTALRAIRATL